MISVKHSGFVIKFDCNLLTELLKRNLLFQLEHRFLSLCHYGTARVLEAGMVLTVEPGCYFNDFLLNKIRRCRLTSG